MNLVEALGWDYAVHIHQALKKRAILVLTEDTTLPMMYMPDAHDTIDLMEAPSDNVKIRSSYNISGVSFNPEIVKKLTNTCQILALYNLIIDRI